MFTLKVVDRFGNAVDFLIVGEFVYEGEQYFCIADDGDEASHFSDVIKVAGDEFDYVFDPYIIEIAKEQSKKNDDLGKAREPETGNLAVHEEESESSSDLDAHGAAVDENLPKTSEILKEMEELERMLEDEDLEYEELEELARILKGEDTAPSPAAHTYYKVESDAVTSDDFDIEDLFPVDAEDIEIAPFDAEKYASLSSHPVYAYAVKAFSKGDYTSATTVLSGILENNPFAYALLGEIFYCGLRCKRNYRKAFDLFKRDAENGCPLAAAWLAECFRAGRPVEKDEFRAVKIYLQILPDLTKMCDMGSTAAMRTLGLFYHTKYMIELHSAEGVELFKKAYRAGDVHAAIDLASCFLNGIGVEKNPDKAIILLNKHKIAGNGRSLFLLGRCFYRGDGVERDDRSAFKHFKEAALLGHPGAKDYLGECYYYGRGTQKNLPLALKWYKDAADCDNVGSAAYMAGIMYLEGDGVPQDLKSAMKYLLLAGHLGDAQASLVLANELVEGKRFKQDFELARSLLEPIAKAGHAKAQLQLGKYYLSNFGFKDEAKGFEWIMKAAEQGHRDAMFFIGGFYEHEIGTQRDQEKAREWYLKAAQANHSGAKLALADLYTETGENLAEIYNLVQALADEGNAKAQYYAGLCCEKGHGCSRNNQKAENYYRNAVLGGFGKAKLPLSRISIDGGRNVDAAYRMLCELERDEEELLLSYEEVGEMDHYLGVCYDYGYGCAKNRKMAKSYYQSAELRKYYDAFPEKKRKRFGLF